MLVILMNITARARSQISLLYALLLVAYSIPIVATMYLSVNTIMVTNGSLNILPLASASCNQFMKCLLYYFIFDPLD